MASNNYKLFKDFLEEELGITKEDIQMWIKESCQEEAEKIVCENFENYKPEEYIKRLILKHNYLFGNSLNKEIIQKASFELTKFLYERLDKNE